MHTCNFRLQSEDWTGIPRGLSTVVEEVEKQQIGGPSLPYFPGVAGTKLTSLPKSTLTEVLPRKFVLLLVRFKCAGAGNIPARPPPPALQKFSGAAGAFPLLKG